MKKYENFIFDISASQPIWQLYEEEMSEARRTVEIHIY